LYDDALDRWFDKPTFDAVVAEEDAVRLRLLELADDLEAEDDEESED
jgi:hypothetical protein